ncbi:MAG: hypothetical protein KAJ29_00030 [Alphaproteobacteria bacterium]|nr:hypothetical protein [Alphaproteobacteria bacterium]
MFKKSKTTYYTMGAAMTVGMLAGNAHAANNFGSIANSINTSIASLPGLIAAIAYLAGLLLAVLGVMKIKDHVENPSQTPLKDGAIRLMAGGMLFGLPILLEAMTETLNTADTGSGASSANLRSVTFGTI